MIHSTSDKPNTVALGKTTPYQPAQYDQADMELLTSFAQDTSLVTIDGMERISLFEPAPADAELSGDCSTIASDYTDRISLVSDEAECEFRFHCTDTYELHSMKLRTEPEIHLYANAEPGERKERRRRPQCDQAQRVYDEDFENDSVGLAKDRGVPTLSREHGVEESSCPFPSAYCTTHASAKAINTERERGTQHDLANSGYREEIVELFVPLDAMRPSLNAFLRSHRSSPILVSR